MSESGFVDRVGPVIGRLLIGGVFAISGIGLIAGFGPVSQLMAAKGVPAPSVLLGVTIAVWLVGGGMLIAGYRQRFAGLALSAFMVPVTLYVHGPWSAAPHEFQNELNHFLKNLAILGALLFIAASDPHRRNG